MSTVDNSKKSQNKIMKSWFLLLVMIIGILSGLYLVHQRMIVESHQNHIENIIDSGVVFRNGTYEKTSQGDVYDRLKASGVTALAIYDTTLEKLENQGLIAIYKGDQAGLVFYDEREVAEPGKTYILPVPGKYGYFQETVESLQHRLGEDRVVLRQSNAGTAIELSQPYKSLVDMKLSISRLEAQEIIAHGLSVVARPSNFKNETREDVDFVLRRLEGLNNVSGIVFVGKEVLGYPHDVEYVAKRLQEMHIPVIGIEATSQLQYEPQLGFYQMAAYNDYSVGRLYTISKDYLRKLEPAAVAQMFYITDMERNVRFNLLPVFEQGKNNQTALGTSLSYIEDLTKKLEKRHFVLGDGSIYPPYTPAFIPLMLTMAGAIALAVFTLQWYVRLGQRKEIILFLILLILSYLGYAKTDSKSILLLWAITSAVAAPVNAIICCMEIWKARTKTTVENLFTTILKGIGFSVMAALLAVIGGIFIASLLGSIDFFMEFSIYRGVKLTFILPVLLAAIAFLQRFPLWKGRTISSAKEGKQFIRELMNTEVKIYMIFIFLALMVVAWIFVGRAGHTNGVPVPHFEVAMRHFLENALVARPREKEFIIGYPALLFAVCAVYRQWPRIWQFLFTLGATIGLGSMVETFAHIRTPVFMSFLRGYNGVWMGVLLGIVAVVAFYCVVFLYKKFIKGGVGNE